MTTRDEVIAHAVACRAALAAGQPRPPWRGGRVSDANLATANLADADLHGADLHGADLRCASLRGADLGGADLRGARLDGADLTRANLRGANLADADLGGADLRGADLIGAKIAEGTICAVAVGKAGGYRWNALRVQAGAVILHYGCDRAALTEWQTRGPAYGARHHYYESHWATGPAVAIAAAETLLNT